MRWGIKLVLLAVGLGLVVPGSAVALSPLSSFGEFGGGPGQLSSPAQLAVDADGDVYVADSGNDRVEVYAGNGAFLRSFGAGKLLEPRDVALDDSGRAYVADSGNHRIDVFSATGAFLFSFGASELVDPAGIDVDASIFGSTVFVADSGSNLIASYTPTGAFVHSFSSVASPRDVVVGSGGNLFVADSGNEWIAVFGKDGSGPIRFIGAGGEGKLSRPVALAVDSLGGIYVADRDAQRLVHFTADGAFLGSTAAPSTAGVGVACEGNVFVSEAAAQFARVQRFGEPGTPPPPCASSLPPLEPIYAPAPKPPSNRFHFAGMRKNLSNGFAVLYVRVPGPGSVKLSGRGFRRLSRSARQATTVAIPVKPKVRLRYFLKRHGKGRIRVIVTFTPTGGEPHSLERVILLRRHRG